ncbi:ABC transporter permease subunit [Pelotomaculum terephthalicicum JT]|uniref:PhnE/PtxC family ABC transporter permease n=1 Tax=Pelotomaculum TaxID=191373 RepID=UPI0009D01B37|nr:MULTISPECIES: ABC transporter permease subunit [Pelotomaculum]MCG9968576.1 ABC transporter permease subunit [Pelotomaculum terephthalicicum JT]OPX84953.1 MAG: Phosphate-import permease protein PhnE [Pelotomaculum sp. PtaB.Bin117]OPY63811.1 MAG: Phosphate-import permease protein PhnE [Pelotomaculum sp. PtaU1.Bin065]
MQADIFAKRRNESLIFFTLLAILTVGSIIITQYDVLKGFTSIAKALIWGCTNFYPDAGSMQKLADILPKLWETVLMSIASTTVAAVFAILLALAGSRTTRMNSLFSVISRGIASLFRNIPLVAWAMVLMLAFSQSPLTGYLALFFGSFGFLARAFMETIDEVSNNAVEALQAAGASYFHIIFQAVLPSSMPQMISWLLYMIDTNIRDATLVGILTGTGIGFSFDLFYKRLDYHAASLVVLLVVITVIVIESISNYVRRVIL